MFEATPPSATAKSSGRYYALLALAVVGLALIGFIGFVVFPSLGVSSGAGAGLLVLAAAAGVASFFSPCSFPLLVGMLGRPVAERAEEGDRQSRRETLAFATALSLGGARESIVRDEH